VDALPKKGKLEPFPAREGTLYRMKIFVSGGDGFIGSHVLEVLVSRGHQVTALCQYNSFNSHGWVDHLPRDVRKQLLVVSGDIRDAGFVLHAVQGHQRVLHLAALIGIPHSYVAPSSYLETNAVGTLNVLEACKAAGVERLIHTSTSEVYGSAEYVPIDERHPLVGQSPYSASKIAADQLAYSYWSSFGLPVTTIRPFNTYGPRQSQRAFIPSVIVQLLARNPELKLGSLAPTRDLTFVKDTARGFADVLESNQGAGETFNMGSGFEISMGEVVKMLSEISGHKPRVSVDEVRVRPAASEVERLWSDSSKMTNSFGWKPEFAGNDGLYRGLEGTYRWLRDNYKLSGYDPDQYVV